MLAQDRSQIDGLYLFPHYMRLDVEGRSTPFMRWRDLPELRAVFGEFLLDLVAQNQNSWFPNECGRCGNSCRRPEILVRGQEIFSIQMHLGLREEEFRQRYLAPARTWNERDGHLVLTSEGNCPFLQSGGGQPGEPQQATCSIYSVRPRSCRELQSNQPYCRKDPGHLLQTLASCWMTPSNLVILLEDGQRRECPLAPGVWERLTQAIIDSPEVEDRRLAEIADSLIEVFGDEIRDFEPAKVDVSYLALVERLHRVLREAADLVPLGDDQHSLGEAWRRYHHLQRLLARPQASPVRHPGKPKARLPWESLVASETKLVARLPFGSEQAFRSDSVHSAQRAFVLSVLLNPDEILQEALTPADPQCMLCGECCRRYSVEIHPSDITRLSVHLEIPARQFVDEYTEPGQFSWNPKDRILKKKSCNAYSRNLLELTVRGQDNDEECVFLDRKEDGLFYCRVHSHKPDVCRAYEPDNSLCRKSNHLENPGRQAENLAWVQVDESQVVVQTRERQEKELGPLVLPRAECEEMDEAARTLEEACLQAWIAAK